MFSITVLKNKLRIITVPMKNTKTVTVLVLVGAGSKYETKEQNGISHFLEHMFFKGTKKRPNTLKISEALDKVGGVYNAFTSKEVTGYFAKVDSSHFDLALNWVSDIFLNSKIEEKEIKKEKGVIVEEINMYQDMPMKYVSDLWEKLLYGNQPAGWFVAGEKENILRFKRKDFLEYITNHYSSQNTVICIAGDFKQEEALRKVRKYFKNISDNKPKDKIKVIEKQRKPQVSLHFKKTDQTHLCLGVRAYNLSNKERYAQGILAIILGGNMSSRLFISVRERNGLAYYIHTESEAYTDTGYLVTQAGVSHKDIMLAIKLILKEYKNIRNKKISSQELQKTKDYIKGILTLSLESSDAQTSFFADQELLQGEILTSEEKIARINKITVQDVLEVAQDIFTPEKLNLAVIGPHKNKEDFQKLLKFN